MKTRESDERSGCSTLFVEHQWVNLDLEASFVILHAYLPEIFKSKSRYDFQKF